MIKDVSNEMPNTAKARDERRRLAIELLEKLEKMEAEPTLPKAALPELRRTRNETLNFLYLDAQERGISNDDH